MSFDYSRPEYAHGPESLRAIHAMQKIPLWARRKHYRQWDTSIPPFIYRYQDFRVDQPLSMKKAADLLVDSRLYLPAPSDFNDPYDFRAVIALAADPVTRRRSLEKSARRVLKDHPQIASHISGTARKIDWLTRRAMTKSIESPDAAVEAFDRARDRNGVACFCLDPRNLLMWSLYSAGYSGICLQFDVTRDLGVLGVVHPVTYHDDIAHLIWPEDRDRIVADVILRKGNIWQHEQEVRYVSLTTVRNSIAFDGSAVTGVILGSRFPASAYPALKQMLDARASKGLRTPRLFKAIRKTHSYGVALQRHEIP